MLQRAHPFTAANKGSCKSHEICDNLIPTRFLFLLQFILHFPEFFCLVDFLSDSKYAFSHFSWHFFFKILNLHLGRHITKNIYY